MSTLRKQELIDAQKNTFDILIIGGGITGAGVLLESCRLGHSSFLVEMSDFSAGSSSRSSRMIHGGVRYLKYGRISAVLKSLRDRSEVKATFPNIVKLQPILMCVYHSPIRLTLLHLFISIYTWLSPKKDRFIAKKLATNEVLDLHPNLERQNLVGGVLYRDGLANDTDLVMATLLKAQNHGAQFFNYLEAQEFRHEDQHIFVSCQDHETGNVLNFKTKCIINATGVWTDLSLKKFGLGSTPILQPSKGTHVLVSKNIIDLKSSLIFKDNKAQRYLYAFSWNEDLSAIGTTDQLHEDEKNRVIGSKEEVDYILDSYNALTKNNLSVSDIVAIYAGLRPLLNQNSKNPISASRDYKVWSPKERVTFIAGGKLTSFLRMARTCLSKARSNGWISPSNQSTQSEKIQWEIVRDELILSKCSEESIKSHWQALKLCHLEDLFTHRTDITYQMTTYDSKYVDSIIQLIAEMNNNSVEWIEKEKLRYKNHWQQFHPSFLHKNLSI